MLVRTVPADSLPTIQQNRPVPNAVQWFIVCYFLLHILVECPSNISLQAEVFWLSLFPTLCYRYVFTKEWEVLSGYVAIFVSSYQYYMIIITILDIFGEAMALPYRQCKRYPISTSRSVSNSAEISIIFMEVVFRGVTLCSCERSFRRFARSNVFLFSKQPIFREGNFNVV